MAAVYDGGVVMGADSRTSTGVLLPLPCNVSARIEGYSYTNVPFARA
jgi:hypothetical protein